MIVNYSIKRDIAALQSLLFFLDASLTQMLRLANTASKDKMKKSTRNSTVNEYAWSKPSLIAAAIASMALAGVQAQAQEQDTTAKAPTRVEITGSAIKRVDSESALPVQGLAVRDIQRAV